MKITHRFCDGGNVAFCNRALAAFATALAVHAAGAAETYPIRPIRMIVPQSAGGSTDLVARIIAQRLDDTLKQPVVVDNRPGAGSINGTDIVAKATPDGYTLLAIAASFTITPSLRRNLPFDPVRDFIPITQFVTLPHILVVHPSVPATTVKDLIALLKSKPGALNCAISGVGTSTHLALEQFMYMTGTRMLPVPYKGGAPGMTALLGGQVQLYFATISTALPHVKAGRLRALAVTSARRSTAAPEFPTVAESGLPGFEASGWVGMIGPANMPKDVVRRLNKEIVDTLKQKDVIDRMLADGAVPTPSSPEEFTAYMNSEFRKWGDVVKIANIKPR
ncbi:MAG: tripartite tricarboxylate transporter substrate binding protein [Burkholderiales bacterium]|nr:tripartite tricarboxylate transporter substrate binding protein [Burkholderiales bacterium]